MIKNLRLYACSHGLVEKPKTSNYGVWISEDSFGWHMAQKLNLNFVNKSQAGASNYHIFEIIYNDLTSITDEDLVLVQWSYTDRAYYKKFETIMPSTSGKISRVYYKYLYYELQEISKVFGFTTMLQSMISNFYFNFVDGSDFFNTHSSKTFAIINNTPNFLNINRKRLPMLYPNKLVDGVHFNKNGHKLLSEKYVDTLSPLLYNIKK
jgi:hypothetical protein